MTVVKKLAFYLPNIENAVHIHTLNDCLQTGIFQIRMNIELFLPISTQGDRKFFVVNQNPSNSFLYFDASYSEFQWSNGLMYLMQDIRLSF